MATIQQFDASVNLLRAILWQYEEADALLALARAKQAWYNDNLTAFWNDWYRDVFNIDTANDFGFAIWGRILGVPMSIELEPTTGRPVWGFGTNNRNFNNGGFGRATTGTAGLTAEQKRLVLKLRYFQITHKPTVPAINRMLRDVFGEFGTVVVDDPLDMGEITYFFLFTPPALLRNILENFDILPRPSAVGVRTLVQVRPSWGFGVHHLNFERGNFGRL
jgi:hypothetical protein